MPWLILEIVGFMANSVAAELAARRSTAMATANGAVLAPIGANMVISKPNGTVLAPVGERGGRGDDRRAATSWRSGDWSQSSWRSSSPSWSTDVTLPGDGDPMADVKAKPAWARMAPIPGGEVSNRVCLDFLAAQLEEAATGVALGS